MQRAAANATTTRQNSKDIKLKTQRSSRVAPGKPKKHIAASALPGLHGQRVTCTQFEGERHADAAADADADDDAAGDDDDDAW